MRKRPPRPWFAVGMDFFNYKGDHVMAVMDYLTSYIVTHTFRSTPSAKQWDRAEMDKGGKLTLAERAHVLSLFNDSPRAVGSASPARLHFRRQYRHPGAPVFEIEVFEKGEEVIE